jgi:tellurite resistance protein
MPLYHNGKLEIQPRVTHCALTADDWELYNLPGRKMAAHKLNNAIKRLANATGATRDSVRQGVTEVMRKHAEVGAFDSEAFWMLEFILNKLFPAAESI